jgi:hypothetical protein
LILALDGGEWSTSRPGTFTTEDFVPGTHWIEGWMGIRACLKAVEKRKILPLPGIEIRQLNPQSVAVPTELSRLLTYYSQLL